MKYSFRAPRFSMISVVALMATTIFVSAYKLAPNSFGLDSDYIPFAPSTKMLRVPLTDQATNYTCGVAALQSVLMYYDRSFGYLEMDLSEELKVDTESGAKYRKMASFAESLGFKAKLKRDISLDELKGYIDRGMPVIVLIQAWADEENPQWEKMQDNGHYVVVSGYDAKNIYFMDPILTGNYGFIPTQEFMRRWHLLDDEWMGGDEILEHFALVISKGAPQFDGSLARRIH